MKRKLRIVANVGGNGGAAVAKSLVKTNVPDLILYTTFIASATDDGISTGRLRKKYKGVGGYYGDVTRILDALRSAKYADWLPNKSAARFKDGIAQGQLLGELLGATFGGTFASSFRGPYQSEAIESLCRVFHIDQIKDDAVRELILEALQYPLEADDFTEHSLRNMVLFALERTATRLGLTLSKALEAMHALYEIPQQYRVIPVTWEPTVLKARTISGKLIPDQFLIDFRDRDPNYEPFDEIKDMWVDPPASAASQATEAMSEADIVLVSCGSLDGNVKAQYLMKGMREALRERIDSFKRENGFHLPIIYVMNLLIEPGNTLSGKPYTAADIVDRVQSAIGRRPTCIIYDTTPLSADDKKHLLPKEKIKLGNLKNYPTSSHTPFLLQREVARVVRHNDPDRPPDITHDPEKLSLVFSEVFSEIFAGVRS